MYTSVLRLLGQFMTCPPQTPTAARLLFAQLSTLRLGNAKNLEIFDFSNFSNFVT